MARRKKIDFAKTNEDLETWLGRLRNTTESLSCNRAVELKTGQQWELKVRSIASRTKTSPMVLSHTGVMMIQIQLCQPPTNKAPNLPVYLCLFLLKFYSKGTVSSTKEHSLASMAIASMKRSLLLSQCFRERAGVGKGRDGWLEYGKDSGTTTRRNMDIPDRFLSLQLLTDIFDTSSRLLPKKFKC